MQDDHRPVSARISPTVLAAVVIAGICALTLWETRGQTFLADEWGRLLNYNDADADFYLRGYSGHLVILHVLLYKALFDVFGADSYLPFRILHVVLLASCLALFFVLGRRRADPWIALLATCVVAALGSAWEITATPAGTIILLPLALGLAAVLALDRQTKAGDITACALLVAAVAAHSLGLAFLAAAAVLVFTRTRPIPWRSAWIFLIPAILYFAWFIWSRSGPGYAPGTEPVHYTGATEIPRGVLELAAATLASVTGLFRSPFSGDVSFNDVSGWILLVPVAVLTALGLRRRGVDRPSACAFLAALLAYWVLISLVLSDARPADSGRYIYPSVVLLLLGLLELSRGIRWTPRVRAGVVALVALSVAINLVNLHQESKELRYRGTLLRSASGALGLMGNQVPGFFDPNYALTYVDSSFDGAMGPNDVRFHTAMSRYGNPGFDVKEVMGAGPPAQALADRMLMADRSIEGQPLAKPPATTPEQRKGCRVLRPGPGRIAELTAGSRLTVSATGAGTQPLSLYARKFSPLFQGLPATGTATSYEVIGSKTDRSGLPWKLQVSAPALVCPDPG